MHVVYISMLLVKIRVLVTKVMYYNYYYQPVTRVTKKLPTTNLHFTFCIPYGSNSNQNNIDINIRKRSS